MSREAATKSWVGLDPGKDKTTLERHLTARYGELFAAEVDVLLYDLTSSYIEGAAPNNPMMHRG